MQDLFRRDCKRREITLLGIVGVKNRIMEDNQDVRWRQRYCNYHKACRKIRELVDSGCAVDDFSDLEREGVIQRFEYTYELAWKVLQDYLLYKGYVFVSGPNGTLQMAFEDGLISNHDGWRRMGMARNLASHTYNEVEAREIVTNVLNEYAPLLLSLDDKLAGLLI